jgi:hypothetical protein
MAFVLFIFVLYPAIRGIPAHPVYLFPILNVNQNRFQLSPACRCLGLSLQRSIISLRRKMNWQGGRLVLFPLLFFMLCWPVQSVLIMGLKRCRNGEVGTLNRIMAGGMNAEIVISGSSRAVYHYDPRIIEAYAKEKTVNIGRDGTKLDEQLALLKTYLKHNRKPEYVIQNLDSFSLRANDGVTDPLQYMAWLDEPDLYQNVLSHRRYFRIYHYLPLLGIIREGAVQPAIEGLFGSSIQAGDDVAGYHPQNLDWNGEFERFKEQHPSGVQWPIDAQGLDTLRDMLELCQHEGIQLILVYSPEYIESQVLTKNRTDIFAAFHALAAEFQAPFWDYSSDPMCRDRTYFYNSQHLNQNGATLFSQKVGNRLAQAGGLHP